MKVEEVFRKSKSLKELRSRIPNICREIPKLHHPRIISKNYYEGKNWMLVCIWKKGMALVEFLEGWPQSLLYAFLSS